MPHRRTRPADGRARRGSGSNPGPRLPGLRWVPVPLALLVAALGWIVLGSLQGQNAAAHEHQHGYQAGGLALSIEQMVWMSNDMTGQGPLKLPKGFPMDPSMMPGMQAPGTDRLRFEVDLSNITTGLRRYAVSDFLVTAPDGQSWKPNENGGSAAQATLEPGFRATVDMYFDVPDKQSKNLTIQWSRDGTTVEFPVDTNGVPSPHTH
jgi:hypothetical protein